MAVPCVGEFWGVQYYVGEGFHARLVVSVVEGKEVIITTPDLDVYEEDFDLAKNADIIALVRMGPAGGKPRSGPGSGADVEWRMFGPTFTRADRQHFLEVGAAYRDDLLSTRGVVLPVVDAAAAPPPLPQDVTGSWIIAEGGPLRGAQWTPTGREVYIGSVGALGDGRGVAIVAGIPTFTQWAPHTELHVFAEACYKCGPSAVPVGQVGGAAAPADAGALGAGINVGGPTRLQALLAKPGPLRKQVRGRLLTTASFLS